MKKLIIIIGLFLLTACATVKMSPKQAIDKMSEEENYIIVDVRTKEEYDSSHVVGSINIPYDTIDENTDLDKSKTIIVYCRRGKRSSIASEILKKLGYNVLDLGAFDSINLDKEWKKSFFFIMFMIFY